MLRASVLSRISTTGSSDGRIWTSAGRNVFCYATDGTHIGTIPIGELVANVCFGGPKRNRLYICGQTSLYAIYTKARGI